MQLLYNSDNFAVVQFDVGASAGEGVAARARGGYEIVDKFARKEIFLAGALAERFAAGVKELVEGAPGEEPSVEAFDEYITGYAALAHQPLLVH